MSEGCYVSEIRAFAGNYVPDGWIPCDGRLLDVNDSRYEALFNAIGTTYGGDGSITFGVPDLQARVAVHQGQGPGLTLRRLGDAGGTPEWPLDRTQIPAHTHTLTADTQEASDTDGFNRTVAAPSGGAVFYAPPSIANKAKLATGTVLPTGWGNPHTNLMPTVGILYGISTIGVFPTA